MPVQYIRSLTTPKRTAAANRHLGLTLAFVAGATNAGGFLAVHQYTSHMSGVVSSIADNLVLGQVGLVLAGLASLAAFMSGAATSAIMVNYGRRRRLQSEYAAPLLLEAVLLLCFGLLGARLLTVQTFVAVPLTVVLLCFLMGLQNAVITKLSGAEIRTTHVTGMVTDIGIELGKLVYLNRSGAGAKRVLADRVRLKVLGAMVGSFFVGGVAGAIGFSRAGFASTIPLAALILAVAGLPVVDDAISLVRFLRRKRSG